MRPLRRLQASKDARTLAASMGLDWHVGDIVRKLREQRRWTQSQLGAKAGGLNKATIVRVEENGNVKRETLEAVARGLGMTMAGLYALIPLSEQETVQAQTVAGATFHGSEQRIVDLGHGPAGARRRSTDR